MNHQAEVSFKSLQVYIYTALKPVRLMAAQGQEGIRTQAEDLQAALGKVSSKVCAINS